MSTSSFAPSNHARTHPSGSLLTVAYVEDRGLVTVDQIEVPTTFDLRGVGRGQRCVVDLIAVVGTVRELPCVNPGRVGDRVDEEQLGEVEVGPEDQAVPVARPSGWMC